MKSEDVAQPFGPGKQRRGETTREDAAGCWVGVTGRVRRRPNGRSRRELAVQATKRRMVRATFAPKTHPMFTFGERALLGGRERAPES